MQITAEEASYLVEQQQIAHKLLAGFYRNILACFNQLAKKCGYSFYQWEPLETAWPGKANPSTKWIWDYLPLYASCFVYKKSDEQTHARPGDCVLVFRLYCDEGFRSVWRTGYVDPVDLESKEGCVEMMIYRCISASRSSCSDLFNETQWPELKPPFAEGWYDVESQNMKAYYRRYSLENFITQQDSIHANIIEYTSKDFKVPEI